ncbi:hypothetical protein K493DRAFT_305995 [Basidiobolus meristosporus CBS 931.73]|uniref:Uncharacterized protein n=1 Tax=Basidiobolus meristosporus CBS 931.73 TaxID=1314790 RepID=A0A1Y1XUI9_9FUNG|nr:hypothetical protein K493DRAFT_305995 [Basidiobolus meristosporus CBS 931.73]|eukprot:ORX89156.1 hypothetical protein K493DRAFT_305995 [Basidiobolus meristosporus CBS 931.73]
MEQVAVCLNCLSQINKLIKNSNENQQNFKKQEQLLLKCNQGTNQNLELLQKFDKVKQNVEQANQKCEDLKREFDQFLNNISPNYIKYSSETKLEEFKNIFVNNKLSEKV